MNYILPILIILSLLSCEKSTIIPNNFSALPGFKADNRNFHDLVYLKNGNCSGATMVFSDEFDGTSISTQWNKNTWFTNRYLYLEPDATGNSWGFNTLDANRTLICKTFLSENSPIIQNNKAKIRQGCDQTFQGINYDFFQGYMQTNLTFLYGYFEIQAKISSGDIVGSNFWLFGGGEEIDIFENIGIAPNTFCTNIHYDLNGSNILGHSGMNINLNTNLSEGYHTIGLDWQPGRLTWYVDHKIVRQVVDSEKVPHHSMNLILSTNVPHASDFISNSDIINAKNNNPVFTDYEIEYVRVFDKMPTSGLIASTDGSGNITTMSNYTDWSCLWDEIGTGDFNGDSFSDLFFYSKSNSVLYIASTDGNGNIISLSTIPNFGNSWDKIISGKFGGSSRSDLFMYSKATGQVKFYTLDNTFNYFATGSILSDISNWDIVVSGDFYSNSFTDDIYLYKKNSGNLVLLNVSNIGNLSQISSFNTSLYWSKIIAGNFNGIGTSELLCYNGNTAGFYNMYQNNLQHIRTYNDWRTTWHNIVSGNFNSIVGHDLLMYDRNGEAYFFQVNNNYSLSTIKSYNDWNHSWNLIISGQFDANTFSDLLFYDNNL